MESVNLIHPNNVSLFEGIYRNKKVLITGNTGLKSSMAQCMDAYARSKGIRAVKRHADQAF